MSQSRVFYLSRCGPYCIEIQSIKVEIQHAKVTSTLSEAVVLRLQDLRSGYVPRVVQALVSEADHGG